MDCLFSCFRTSPDYRRRSLDSDCTSYNESMAGGGPPLDTNYGTLREQLIKAYGPWLNWHLTSFRFGQPMVTWNYFYPNGYYSISLEADSVPGAQGKKFGSLIIEFEDEKGKKQTLKGQVKCNNKAADGHLLEIVGPAEGSTRPNWNAADKSQMVTVSDGLARAYANQLKNIEEGPAGCDEATTKFLCEVLMLTRSDSDNPNNLNMKRSNRLSAGPAINGKEFGLAMNKSQVVIVNHAIGHRLTLVQAPPGTGDTATLSALCHHLYETRQDQRSKILVCSRSNVAGDNLAKAIQAKGRLRIVRIRSSEAKRYAERHQHPDTYNRLYLDTLVGGEGELQRLAGEEKQAAAGTRLHRECRKKLSDRKQRLEDSFLANAQVICCTCEGTVRRCIKEAGHVFDSVIIDQSCQVSVPETLMALFLVPRRMVLVGDHQQLGLCIEKDLASQGYNEDNIILYNLLRRFFPLWQLNQQDTMHPELFKFSNQLFYEARIKDGTTVRTGGREWSCIGRGPSPFPNSAKPVYFQCHQSLETRLPGSRSFQNVYEAESVEKTIAKLIGEHKIKPETIGVMAIYKAQSNLIREKLYQMRVEVGTVDSFQAGEKDLMLVSFVRSTTNQQSDLSFVGDAKRLNVAVTRAKYGLILIGNPDTLALDPLLRELLLHLSQRGLMFKGLLSASAAPFEWPSGKRAKTGGKRRPRK